MINSNYICVFDTETSGTSWETDELVQIAAIILDPHTLEEVPDSSFNSLIKPTKIFSGSEDEIRTKWQKSQGAWDVNKKTRAELENAPLPEHVIKTFANHLKKYNRPGWGGKILPAGHNIQGFDLHWIDAYCKRYKIAVDKNGKQQIFNTTRILDTMNMAFMWFENAQEPTTLKLDDLRDYFGMSKENNHDALQDCRDTASILCRFMKLHRHFSPKVKFKNAFKNQ